MENDTTDVLTTVNITPYTEFVTPNGDIHVIQSITLGDMLISTLLLALIIFTVLAKFIKRRG